MSAYYNENDQFAAQWLRNLIDRGLIPAGDVDERSITDVSGDDLTGYTQCHFFAGIGGWPLALRIAGWPDDVPVWTGSCPCQPFSAAGKRKGKDDKRHLWPDFHRLIGFSKPSDVVGEQVASKDGRLWLAGVRADLEALGYAVGGADLCAAGIGAPDIRQRLFWGGRLADAGGAERGRWAQPGGEHGIRVHAADGGGAGRMADAASLRGTEYVDHAGERTGGGQDNSPDGHSTGGLADSDGGSNQQQNGYATQRGRSRETEQAGMGGRIGGLVNGEQPGLEGYRGDEDHRDEPGRFAAGPHGSTAAAGSWSAFRVVQCRDGRARRVPLPESGVQPLAYGIPVSLGRGRTRLQRMAIRAARANRVGRLKGYGNAIVPELAAEFVMAYMEATEEQSC